MYYSSTVRHVSVYLSFVGRFSDLATALALALTQVMFPSLDRLFERFDRLLFLMKGGRTAYFSEVGKNSEKLISYFERNGGPKYKQGQNPAEWMLEVIGAAPGSHTDIDWHQTWLDSPERQGVRDELARLRTAQPEHAIPKDEDPSAFKEFAAPLSVQYWECQRRVFQQLWRTPVYIFSKFALVSIVGLFIGFSLFKAENTSQGSQNQLFSIFLLFTVFGQLVQQYVLGGIWFLSLELDADVSFFSFFILSLTIQNHASIRFSASAL